MSVAWARNTGFWKNVYADERQRKNPIKPTVCHFLFQSRFGSSVKVVLITGPDPVRLPEF
jgi:hypothetical protein